MKKNNIKNTEKLEKLNADDIEFQAIVQEFVNHPVVQEMKNYRIHAGTSCFDHCYAVSYYCYRLCKKLNLDYVSATRAGMLHDFYLYDWRIKNSHYGHHAFTHGKVALNNACKYFNLNAKEKDIILKHMWPLTLTPPKYKEGFILTLVDKHCATFELLESIKFKFSKKASAF